MKCKPEDAPHFKCCIKNRPCSGKGCMAWVDEYVRPTGEAALGGEKLGMRPGKPVETGLGFCGLIENPITRRDSTNAHK